jgi:photosystem II stability/assembly factor-like uncharacterized protein
VEESDASLIHFCIQPKRLGQGSNASLHTEKIGAFSLGHKIPDPRVGFSLCDGSDCVITASFLKRYIRAIFMSRYFLRSTVGLSFFFCLFFIPFLRPATACAQWTAIAPNLNTTPEDFFGCLTFKDGLLCFGDRYVKVSQDSGVTWRLATLNPPLKLRPTGFVNEIRFYSKRFGVLGTGNGYVYVTQDSGASWQAVLVDPPHPFTAVTFLGSPMDIMVATWDTSKVYTSSDFGQTWTLTAFPDSSCHQLYATSNTDAIALGSVYVVPPSIPPGHYYVTTDRGQTWTQKPFLVDLDTYSFAIDECEPQTLYASSEHRMIVDDGVSKMFVTHDYGTTGSVTLRRNAPNLGTSIVTTPNAVYCGSTYGIQRSTDQGANWLFVGGPAQNFDVRIMAAASDNIIFAMDMQGTLWRTLDGGILWPVLPRPGFASITIPQPFVVKTCSPEETEVHFRMGNTCQAIELSGISLSGSPAFVLDTLLHRPSFIASDDSIAIQYLHIPNHNDTCKLKLEFLVGSTIEDTTIEILGSGAPALNTVHLTSIVSPSTTVAGHQVTMQIFTDHPISNLGLDSLEFDLQYNGDLLTLVHDTTTVAGANLATDTAHISGRLITLPIKLKGANMQLDSATPVIELTFDVSVTDTNATALSLLDLQFNRDDSSYTICTLDGDIASTSFSLDSECADPIIEQFLKSGKVPIASDAAYPDPITTSSNFKSIVSFSSGMSGVISLELIDVSGHTVQQSSLNLASPGSGAFTIDGRNLPAGKYFYRIASAQGEALSEHPIVIVR